MRVAFLSSYTIDPLARHIVERAKLHGLEIEPWVAPFDTWMQQLIDPGSELVRFAPDVTIVAVDGDRVSEGGEITSVLRAFATRSLGKIIVHSFVPASVSVRDIQASAIAQSTNDQIRSISADLQNIFLLDLDTVIRQAGVQITDPKMELLAAMKWTEAFLPHLADAHLSFLVPMAGMTRKVLVLDLDGTLWGGVIGEDGMDGLALGPQAPGNAYVAFQKAVKAVQERGILLAIVSKNNEEDGLQVIREHSGMVLKESDFVTMRINWEDKVTNMRSIAEELNVGLDSFVFFDDDPGNRLLAQQEAPEILTVDVPADPARYVETLLRIPELEVLHLTDEDKKRTELYAAERERKGAAAEAPNMDAFLRSLEMKAEIRENDTTQIARLAQLTQKTNQFNTTTERYTEEQIRQFMNSKDFGVWSIRVVDRFGDNGIVGMGVVKKINKWISEGKTSQDDIWLLELFLLSCRVLGRGVENALISKIIEAARKEDNKITDLYIDFVQSSKNSIVESYLERTFDPGMTIWSENARWYWPIRKNFPAPDWITYG